MQKDDLKNKTHADANNVLADGLSLIQAKDAAMIEGKKIRHRFFTDDEFLYYKKGSFYTEDDYELSGSYWLSAQSLGWVNGWSVVS